MARPANKKTTKPPPPDPKVPIKDAVYWVVSCGGCHQKIGIALDKSPSRAKIYCSEMCAADHIVWAEQERRDHWEFLVSKGYTKLEIARIWGVPHAVVYRTLDKVREPVLTRFPWLLTEEPE